MIVDYTKASRNGKACREVSAVCMGYYYGTVHSDILEAAAGAMKAPPWLELGDRARAELARRAALDVGPDWYIVFSQGRMILGVYGSALLSMAQECARRVERETGLPAFIEGVYGARPSVGQYSP